MLVLASASPRRRELLERIGVAVDVRPADVDESLVAGEAALDYVRRVASAKAAALAATGGWVLAADTIVEIDGVVLGKAADADEAGAMLRQLRGRDHRVATAVVLAGPAGRRERLVVTEVAMIDASDELIDDYVASGEWQGKAGGYAVQGMAAALVSAIRGSITNVIGLPLAEVVELLRDTGAAAPRFRQGRPA